MTALPTYPLTFDDLLLMPDDGKRRELIDGALIVSPPPEWRLQVWLACSINTLLRLPTRAMGVKHWYHR